MTFVKNQLYSNTKTAIISLNACYDVCNCSNNLNKTFHVIFMSMKLLFKKIINIIFNKTLSQQHSFGLMPLKI